MEYRTYDAVIMPDGYEVEAAVVHPPVIGAAGDAMPWGEKKSKLQQLKESGLGRVRQMQQIVAKQSDNGMHKLHDVTRTVSVQADVMRARGLERWRDVQRTVSDRTSSMQSTLHRKIEDLKSVAGEQMTKLNSDVHSNVPKWAGIAAGAGLALGIGGRIMRNRHHRHHHHHEHIPTLVVVEATC